MQVKELVKLGSFLKNSLEKNGLVSLYQQLIASINQAAQNQSPQNVHVYLQQIKDTHVNADREILSPAQHKIMIEYGADKLLGKVALKRLEDIFSKNQAHPQGLVANLQSLMNETTQLVQRASQLIEVLSPMIEGLDLDGDELADDEGRIWLYFTHDVQIETISELEEAAETWRFILHNFSRMPGATADSWKILQIQKHSPMELELAANAALLLPLAYGIKYVLSRIKDVINICQEAEKLKQLKIKTKTIEALFEDAKEQRENIAEEASEDIQKKFECDNETKSAVKQALKRIIKFIEGGGQLDIDTNHSSDEEENGTEENENQNNVQLRALIESIRDEIKLLPILESDEE